LKKDQAVQVGYDDFSKITVSYFIKNNRQLSSFCGVNTYVGFDGLVDTIDKVLSHIKYPTKFKLGTREMLYLCLTKLKTGLSFSCIAPLFQISITTAISYFNIMIDILYLI